MEPRELGGRAIGRYCMVFPHTQDKVNIQLEKSQWFSKVVRHAVMAGCMINKSRAGTKTHSLSVSLNLKSMLRSKSQKSTRRLGRAFEHNRYIYAVAHSCHSFMRLNRLIPQTAGRLIKP